MLSRDLALRLDAVAGADSVPSGDWSGVDAFLPLLERMRAEGAVVVLKLDGLRTDDDESPPYTVVISGGLLEDDYVTVEAPELAEALARATLDYAERAWLGG